MIPILTEVRFKQGKLLEKMDALGFDLQFQTIFQILTNDVVKSSEIEGETLYTDQVGTLHYFPTGRSGMYRIVVGDWYKNTKYNPMQVVSGALDFDRVADEMVMGVYLG